MEQAHQLEDERRARFVVVDEEDAHVAAAVAAAVATTVTTPAVATTLTAGVGASASRVRWLRSRRSFTAAVQRLR